MWNTDKTEAAIQDIQDWWFWIYCYSKKKYLFFTIICSDIGTNELLKK